ncbi:type VII toxin-antitoxin system MntA family adenylyltransferase antitoxin [Rheinheimera oceanensis]|uniref:type VII toxin-antitoxin system MntA family adenylyltransferase antitoxin n=1 Tax=Rheinheimera oceanensis TaxID=2817449 RepID=UPI001BFD050F|nr:nucleotidyltransferase domain-containing protein [Rheinheimera oceanensis]
MTDKITLQLAAMAAADSNILALWLYGSRARGNARTDSDYDLAVLFASSPTDELERRLQPELLALDWQQLLACPALSVINIMQVPLPLAISVLEDNTVLYCRDDTARLLAEARLMSKWELDYQYHQANYA